MTYRRKLFTSDSPNEDLGYSRTHRQTIGGMQAYARGEMPLTYWDKKTIIQRLTALFKKIRRDEKYYNRYKKFISDMNMSLEEVLENLGKVKLDILKHTVLEYKGTHYTGNFFRYTKFYGLVEPVTLLIRVKNKLVKPIEVVQLTLNL